MSEEINGKKVFSLFEVTRSIQKTIAERYKSSYWIKAELNKLNFYTQSGHCYPELVEKIDGKVVTQIRCNLWKEDYKRINANFQNVLKEPIKDGIKVLLLATIGFHPEHGLTLRIIDIDPSFTLGDLEKEKQETIVRLQKEGIYTSNKQLKLPLLPQRIAIISVETSKGYADFVKVIQSANSNWKYKFFLMLFPSLLQGDSATGSMIQQLRRIKRVKQHFDVVAIVRGGGGDIGLSCYNNYDLAKEIALFPLPVFTGIGHSTNETVAEMIAHENAITPTKLAELLIQRLHNFSVPLQRAQEKIIDKSRRLIQEEKTLFSSEVKLLRSVSKNILVQKQNDTKRQIQALFQQSRFRIFNERATLNSLREKIKKDTYQFCTSAKQNILQFGILIKRDIVGQIKQTAMILSNTGQNLSNLSPKNVLKRGYSITLLNGKSIRTFDQVEEGQILITNLYQGNIVSTVKSSNKPLNNE